MATLQDIQNLKTRLQGVRDKTVQAQTKYENAIERLKQELASVVSLFSDEAKEDFFAKFKGSAFLGGEKEDGSFEVTEIVDIAKVSEMVSYIEEEIIKKMDADIGEKYDEIKRTVEEWDKIVRGEANES